MLPPVGILGGTFDPVHVGHLRIALECQQNLGLSNVRLIPSASPPHRDTPSATVDQRVSMVERAILAAPYLQLDNREQQRTGLSYTVDTLKSLREEFPSTPLCLIVGSDAFEGLASWHRWQALLDYAHIVIAYRPGWQRNFDQGVGALLANHFVSEIKPLHENLSGKVFPCPVTQLAVSASAIRQMIMEGKSAQFLVPDSVWEFIQLNRLYR